MRSRNAASCAASCALDSPDAERLPTASALSCRAGHLQRPPLPRPHNPEGAQRGQQKDRHRHDPRHVVEAAADGRGKDRRPVLRRKPVEHRGVVAPGGHLRLQLADHARRIRAAHVVALQQDLPAPATAHQLVPQPVEARLPRAQHRNGDDAEQSELHRPRPEHRTTREPRASKLFASGLCGLRHGAPSPHRSPRPAPQRNPPAAPALASGQDSAPEQ